ncbi:MAG: homoserine dehydrogenase [Acidobacteriota bacterium]
MAMRLSIVQIGKGTIGGRLIDQVAACRAALRERIGVDLSYAGIAGRSAAAFEMGGLDLGRWREVVEAGRGADGRRLLEEVRGLADPKVLIDATAGDGMAGLYETAFAAGFHVVSCNKKPLAGPLDDYRRVQQACRGARRRWLYEVTVGAGLPTLRILRDLVDTGDRIHSIEGCFSGTLNYLCAGLDRGGRLSEVLARARGLGYTEPDPREDLSGRDVARKALILAREAGLEIEPEQVALYPFFPTAGGDQIGSFPSDTGARDEEMARRFREASGRGARLRYVATVDGGCGAALREVPADGPLGRLRGPENVFVFRTERYAEHPLIVTGPGAGPAVAAAGVFGDLLELARGVVAGGGE